MINKNSKFYYEKEVPVRYNEVNYHLILKPSALLNLLQEIASEAAESLNFGYSATHSQNIGWFVLKYHLEFNNYPQNLKKVMIKTEARGVNRLFAIRDFEIYDNGNLLGRITSQWGLINLLNKSMLNPSEIFSFINKVEKREDDLSFQKIPVIEDMNYQKEFEVRYDDIDVNHHVNNTNYIIWGLEVLPKEFKDKHKIKTIDIMYKKEAQYGDKILAKAEIKNNIATINVENKKTEETLCSILAEYEKI